MKTTKKVTSASTSKSVKSATDKKTAKYPVLAKYNLYPFNCPMLRMNEQKKNAKMAIPADGMGSIQELLKSVDADKVNVMLAQALDDLKKQPVEHIQGHFNEMREVIGVYANKRVALVDKIKGKKKSEYALGLEEIKKAEKTLIENHKFTVGEMEHEILTKVGKTTKTISN